MENFKLYKIPDDADGAQRFYLYQAYDKGFTKGYWLGAGIALAAAIIFRLI